MSLTFTAVRYFDKTLPKDGGECQPIVCCLSDALFTKQSLSKCNCCKWVKKVHIQKHSNLGEGDVPGIYGVVLGMRFDGSKRTKIKGCGGTVLR